MNARRGRPPLPPEARKPKASGPSGSARPPTEAECEQLQEIVNHLRVALVSAPQALGRVRLDDGAPKVPQAFVAEMANIQAKDLSSALNGRAPKSLSVATMLVRLRALQGLQEEGILEVASEARREALVPFPGHKSNY